MNPDDTILIYEKILENKCYSTLEISYHLSKLDEFLGQHSTSYELADKLCIENSLSKLRNSKKKIPGTGVDDFVTLKYHCNLPEEKPSNVIDTSIGMGVCVESSNPSN